MIRFQRDLAFVFLLLFSVLCAAIYAEVAGPDQGQPVELGRRVAAPARIGNAGLVEPVAERSAWFQETVSRPLFSPDRKPVAADARNIRGLPRLAGIIVNGSQRIAIFAAPQNDHPIIVEAGSRIGAYDVRDVTLGGVTVNGPEGTTIIRPIFDTASPALSRSPPPARPELPKPLKK